MVPRNHEDVLVLVLGESVEAIISITPYGLGFRVRRQRQEALTSILTTTLDHFLQSANPKTKQDSRKPTPLFASGLQRLQPGQKTPKPEKPESESPSARPTSR